MTVVLLGVLSALFYAIHDLIARAIAPRLGPFRVAAITMVASGAILTAGLPWYEMAHSRGLVDSLLLGLAYGLGAAGLFKAFSLGPVSFVAPIAGSYPVLVFLWGLATGLQPTAMQWSAVAVTLVGAAIVGRNMGDGERSGVFEPGKFQTFALSCIICVVGYAAAVILGQRAALSVGEVEATWLSRPTSILVILPFLRGEPRSATITPVDWAGILAMAVLDAVGLSIINASGHFDGKEFVAAGIASYGAIAVVLATIVLKERVTYSQWAGIALISVGVAVLSTR